MKSFLLQPACTGALSVALMAAVYTAPAVAAPPTMLEDTYFQASIGDIPGAIDEVADLISKVQPGMDRQAVRANLGRMVGDNDLSTFPAGSGIMLVVPTSGREYFMLETADGQAQSVIDRISPRSPWAFKAPAPNLILGSRTEEGLNEVTDAQTSAVAELLRDNNDKFLNILIDADRLTADKGQELRDRVERHIDQLRQRNDKHTTASATIMRMATNFALAVGKRLDVATLKIDINEDGILFDRAGWSKNGINLDSPEGPAPEELRGRLNVPQQAFLIFDHHLDTQSMMRGLGPIFRETLEGIELTEEERGELQEMWTLAAQAYGDTFVGWYNPTRNEMDGETVVSLNDAEAAEREARMEVESANSGAANKLHRLMGKETSATLRENVREVAGAQVNEFTHTVENMKDTRSDRNKSYSRTGAYAIHDNLMSIAVGNVNIDNLLANSSDAGSGRNVASREHLEDGGFMYMDLYPGALLSSLEQESAKRFAGRVGNAAIYTGNYVDEEKLRGLVLVPTEMLVNIAHGVREAMQGDAPRPELNRSGQTTGTQAQTTGSQTN